MVSSFEKPSAVGASNMKLSSFRKSAGKFLFNKVVIPPKEPSLRMDKFHSDYGHGYYYDELFSGDGEDVRRAVEICQAAPGNVLDLGGGAGRLAIELACRGIRVTLVDHSSTMLEIARMKRKLLSKNARDLFTISPQSLTQLALDTTFQHIFSFNNVLEHFDSDDLVLLALRLANQHLIRGGKFYLDVHLQLYFDKDPLWKTGIWRYSQDKEVSGHRLRVWSRTLPTGIEHEVTCEHAVSENLLSFKLLRTNLRILPYDKWLKLFELAGFRVMENWGSWKKEPISPALPKTVFILEKP